MKISVIFCIKESSYFHLRLFREENCVKILIEYFASLALVIVSEFHFSPHLFRQRAIPPPLLRLLPAAILSPDDT